jgi:ATP-binding cassette, subfamily C, bacterial CydD
LDVLGFPETDFGRPHTRTGRLVEADDVNLRRATKDATMQSPAMRRFLIASVACGVVITGVTIASAVVLAQMVAGVITDPGTRTVAHWAGPLWILAALWLVRASTQWLQGRLSQRGATAVIADLTGRVLHAVTALPPRHLAVERDEAAVLTTSGLDGLKPYFTAYLPSVFLAGILTPAAVVAIAAYDMPSAVVVLIALPLIPVFMVLIGLLTAERSAAALAAMSTLQSRLLDLVAGIPTLRALGRIGGSADRIAELGAAHRRSAMATLRIAFLSSLVLELLATLGVALVAVGVGLRLVYGEMTLSDGLTALLLAPEVFWPLRRVGVEFHAAQDGKSAADRVFRLLDRLPAPAAGASRTVSQGCSGAGATIHLDDLGTDVMPGMVTVLTGPNGVGKTSLLHAILGLQPGGVSIDGVDVADVDVQDWWRQVAWLAHRPVLVPGSVRDNLELFGPVPNLDSACRATGFDEVLADLPEGLETVIGRAGVGLSLGQRQRLGLARTLGSDAPVLLLDEPTSHLDARLESRVLDAIVRRARAGATVLVVGHREPVLAIGDHVLHMGSLVDA